MPIKRAHKISTVNFRHSSHLGTKSNYTGSTNVLLPSFTAQALGFFIRKFAPRQADDDNYHDKSTSLMFCYERVNSTSKFTIVAEIVYLLKKIYERDVPLRAVVKVKTLAVLSPPYPR